MIAVVCHDAGGAEIISSYLRLHRPECTVVAEGPARAVFERKLGVTKVVSLEEAIASAETVLTGTGWQSDLEWEAIGLARRRGKRCVAFLDHWTNYRERFVRRGTCQLPDEIWVGDTEAETQARACFPETKITLVPNPYFLELRDEITDILRENRRELDGDYRVLFVCENTMGYCPGWNGKKQFDNLTEFDAISYFLENIEGLGRAVDEVVLRPHPSDPIGKYARYESDGPLRISVSRGQPLLHDIANVDVVVGWESMALVVGLMAGRRVVSCVPPGGAESRLPHRQIEKFQAPPRRAR